MYKKEALKKVQKDGLGTVTPTNGKWYFGK